MQQTITRLLSILHPGPKFLQLLLCSLCCIGQVAAQEVIRITGVVKSKNKGNALYGVNIIDQDSKRLLTQTDQDGRFAIDVRPKSTLIFSMVGAERRTVKLKEGNFVEVNMEEQDYFLNTTEVVAKRITDRVQPEQTDIEVKGNYLHIRTRVRVPREMFGIDTRLVVQPILSNNTTGTDILMRPLVYDAKTYNRTQQRMYDFEMDKGDPLANYVAVRNRSMREKGRTNDIIGYSDSIYIERIKDEYSCNVYMAIEDYNKICYRDTTTIAKGTVNPLRWLDYSFSAHEITDTTLYPKAEKQLRASKGQIDLRFDIGKAEFNPENPHNQAEIQKLEEQIRNIEQTPDATLQALNIEGTSSPDGRYASNLKLAQKRMDYALNYLRERVPAHLRTNMKFSSNAEVAGWDQVARLLRKDSLFTEAGQLEDIIEKYKHIDAQGQHIRRLKCYRPLLLNTYLPQLRAVGYNMEYTIFRQLNIDEIKALYNKDYRQLSRYEYFRLYRETDDTELREKYLRQALELYPSFMVAANDLQALLIQRNASEPKLLAPFTGEKAPATVNANHAIALIANGQYAAADSVTTYLPVTDEYKLLHAISGALNGRYAENFATIAATGKQNEARMLRSLNRNEEALAICEQLPKEQALTHYLQAICLNRLEKPLEAYEALKKALKANPELEKTALVDGDVNDLLLDKQKK